ncbi:MAG: YceH family protein [Rubrivivax sp.]|nr:YceH family protein [Rubrivivax sp.]
MRNLTPLEARVLGVLVEKQHTVPDTYPLSVNALTAGCNQKTARFPVIEANEAEVMTAVDGLKGLSLVFEGSGSRVVKFEHNMGRVLGVPGQAVALLTVLMLRGPQTAAELRLNCERLHRFADISSVEGFLEELAAKDPPRVVKLPRAPGSREARWAHLLCGEVAEASATAMLDGCGGVSAGELAALKAEQTRLAAEVDALKALVHRMAGELGIEPQ